MFSPRSKGPHIRHGMINARAETLTTEPGYRNDRPEMLDPFGLWSDADLMTAGFLLLPGTVTAMGGSDPERTLALWTRTAAIQRIADTVRIVAFITKAAPMARILTNIGEPAEPPRISPARGPPAWEDLPIEAVPDWDALAPPPPEYVFDQRVQW